MAQSAKINYFDLALESRAGRLPYIVGREAEISRLERIALKHAGAHAIVVAPTGAGKTSLLKGFGKSAAENRAIRSRIVMLSAESLQPAGQVPLAAAQFYQDAFSQLSDAIVIIDDFGSLLAGAYATANWTAILQPLLIKKTVKLILSMRPEELEKLSSHAGFLAEAFDIIRLAPQPKEDMVLILEKFHALGGGTEADEGVFEKIIEYVHRFPSLGALPKSATRILDECAADARLRIRQEGINGGSRPRILSYLIPPRARISEETVNRVVSQKTGIPLSRLGANEKLRLKNLSKELQSRVIGQNPATAAISGVIQRAKLGLRSPGKPLGSFLLLGPSGVGKTETAKVLSEILFGKQESFLRIDMSEFGEAHAVQRLIGSPPGYSGSESGGQLTNHLKKEPYSLILLDEIEKAHSRIFDIFLQLLDDGRLTSGQGELVQADQAVVIATSNLGVEEILTARKRGEDLSDQGRLKETVLPILLKSFRTEFLNRFDSIIAFEPLSETALTDIALLEIKKIENRTKEHGITFDFNPAFLASQVRKLADPRFGARPIKRYIEEVCEKIIAERLLENNA